MMDYICYQKKKKKKKWKRRDDIPFGLGGIHFPRKKLHKFLHCVISLQRARSQQLEVQIT